MKLEFTGHVSVMKNVDGVFYIGFLSVDKVIASEAPADENDTDMCSYFSGKIEEMEFKDLTKIIEYYNQHRPDILETNFLPLDKILGRNWLLDGEILSIVVKPDKMTGNNMVGIGQGLITEFISTEKVSFNPILTASHNNTNRREVFDPQVKKPS